MLSIILLAFNRPELTQQTITSLQSTLAKSSIPHELIIVDNASAPPTRHLLHSYQSRAKVIRLDRNQGVGHGKNIGVTAAKYDKLYISDNDLYYFEGWLESIFRTHASFPEAKIIGAFRHPHHGLLHSHTRGSVAFEQSDQQVGSSWFLTRDTWNTYGPLDTQLPIGSDDVRFCERVTIAGFWVGSISPHQVFHCGATNSEGQWSPGGTELIHTTPPKGVIIK